MSDKCQVCGPNKQEAPIVLCSPCALGIEATADKLTDEHVRELRATVRLEIEALIGLCRDCDDQLARHKRRVQGLPEPSDVGDRCQRIAAAIDARAKAVR